ncbi:hypothetical protein MRX96_025507 [Rhipicephalus microplus]
MDTERFLEEIRHYPFLYDKTMPDYKDIEAKMNTWDLIGSIISVPPKRMHPISSRRISRAATLKRQQTRHHGNVERCAEIVVACHSSDDCTVKSESSDPTLP